ncbi:pyridoxamine 5'-phosphate oxidase family protein [Candidatus Peregrinibacteria bacterium]|nr:pyridoxamine 5'-phosphate oxidase family protein [Candidatus Peregrinibacteria bacterium]
MHGTLSDADMDELLVSGIFGHLGYCDGNKPYVVPLAYVFHDGVIYGQTTEGRKIDLVRKNPLVCFQVQHERNYEWRSVLCWGTFEEFDFERLEHEEALPILTLLTERLGGIQKNVGIVLPSFSLEGAAAAKTVDGRKSVLFRILVTERTGKFYRAEG